MKFSLIYQGDIHLSEDKKVIKAKDYSTLLAAKEVLEKAKEDANTLKKQTKKKCEALKEEAKEAGFQEGLEQLNEEILKMSDETKAARLAMQQQILPIALKAAQRIVAKELEIFPETIVEIVLQVLAPISESRRVTIYVSKEDKALLDKEKPKLQEILPQAEFLTIQEKDNVSPGGCIIQTEGGMINATIENQWKALERAFEKHKRGT